MARLCFTYLGCLLILLTADLAFADESRREGSMISVRGTGKISAVPDVAIVQVGVVTQAPNAKDALAANNESMGRLHASLKEHGIAAKDMQTTQIQVNPQYTQPRPGQNAGQGEFVPRIAGYRVDNMVQITERRIDQLGLLLDALVQSGANQIHGISFRIGESEKLLDEARRRAVTDARRKAELLAGEAGVVLGPLISIQEEGAARPPSPRPMMFAARGMDAAVPVAAGEQELSVSIEIVYEIRQPK
jgi:uncharacterized protein YggE